MTQNWLKYAEAFHRAITSPTSNKKTEVITRLGKRRKTLLVHKIHRQKSSAVNEKEIVISFKKKLV